jgi:ribosome biogenesis GTPase
MIELFGWSDTLQTAFAPHAAAGLAPARVIAQHRDIWRVATAGGEEIVRLSGRFMHTAAAGDFPVVGDWAAIDPAGLLIHACLPRHGAIARRAAGGVGTQWICANIDVAFIVMSLNGDLNPRRLERYLATVAESGAAAVCLLTKADLSLDPQAALDALIPSLGAVASVTISTRTGSGLEAVQPWLQPGATAVLLGSSGAGKSTLLNALIGADAMATGEIRSGDDRGRHTTRHRELFRLANGALLIDTPGLRELGLSVDSEALDTNFADVTALFGACRFSDCRHGKEPGCAVQAALQTGALLEDRWRAYQKLQRETAFEDRKGDPGAAAEARAKWKKIHKAQAAKSRLRDHNADWADDE